PLWTGATHVVQLRPIRIEQRGCEPAPSPSRRPQDPPRSGAHEQHSRDIRICERTHFVSPHLESLALCGAIPKAAKIISSFRTVLPQSAAMIRSRCIREMSPVIELVSVVSRRPETRVW